MERLVVGRRDRPIDGTFLEHYFRYRFAQRWVDDGRVLDCACGTGYGTYILAQRGREVVGIDRSPEALRIAATDWAASNIRYLSLDIDNLETLEEQFDVVVSFETIEHLHDPAGFVRKAHDRLNANGSFIVSTPNKNVYRGGLAPNPFHLHEFCPGEFRDLLSARFNHVEVFVQIAVSLNDRGRTEPAASWSSEFRTALVSAFAGSSFGYSLYLFRMKRRFSVIPSAIYENHQYLVAVCRK